MTNQIHKLLLLIVATFITGSAYAYDAQIDGIYYNLDTDSQTASVTSGNNDYTGDVVIPASVAYGGSTYSVTSIGDKAFYHCYELISVSIPEGVTEIGESAFEDCRGLTSINIPSSVASIGSYAFNYCSGLTSINIPEGVTNIGNYAFDDCYGLTSINIPSSVTSIEGWPFYHCPGLTAINVSSDNPAYCSIDGILYDKDITTLIKYPEGKTGAVNIPSSVTYINTFERCSGLTAINVSPDNPAYCSIDGILYDKDKTTLIQCPRGKTGSVDIPEGVTGIEGLAFYYCSGLTSVNIPSSVTSFGVYAFRGCRGLTSIHIPEGVTSIEEGAFEECSGLTSVKIPSSVTSIGLEAFYNCSGLTSVNIPEGVTRIAEYTFYGCYKLVSVSIPSSVTSIGEGAFQRCSALTSINIPEGVTNISASAFSFCDNLSTIYSFNPVPPTASPGCFNYNHYQSATLYVPQEALDAYQAADIWSNFANIQGFDPTGIKGIEAEDGNLPVAYYDTNGRKYDEPQKGLNIVRYSDGSVRKVMMK